MMMFRHYLIAFALSAGLSAGLLATAGCSHESASHASPQPGEESRTAQATAQEPGAAGAASAAVAAAQQPEGKVYGNGVTGAERVTIAQLLASPDAYAGKSVQVEGTVTDVCPKRGCWFEMAGEKPGEKMRFKVQDGVMVFPLDAKGSHAVAEGVVSTQTLSLEETRKYLEYQATEYGQDVDPASVTEPMTIVRLDGTGAVLSARK